MASYLGSTNNKKDFVNVEYLEHKMDDVTIKLSSEGAGEKFYVPEATVTDFGVVKIDGDTILIDSESDALTVNLNLIQRRLRAGEAIDKQIDSEGIIINVLYDNETVKLDSAGELQAVDLQVKDTLSFAQPTLLSDVLSNDITVVRGSEGNVLIDKFYVDDKMALLLGTYRGYFDSEGALNAAYPRGTTGPASVIGNNDYAYVIDVTSEGNAMVRYKAVCTSTQGSEGVIFTLNHWAQEFRFEAMSFTAAEIAALRSTITQNKVQNYTGHVTQMINMSSEGAGPNPHGVKTVLWRLRNFLDKKIDDELSATSVNPVQNNVINRELNKKQRKLIAGTNIELLGEESEGQVINSAEFAAGQYLTRTTNTANKKYTFSVDTLTAFDSSEEGLVTNNKIKTYLEDNYKPIQIVLDSDNTSEVGYADVFITRVVQNADGTLTFHRSSVPAGSNPTYAGLSDKPTIDGHPINSTNTYASLDIQQLIDADNKLSYTLVDGLHDVAHTGDYDDLSDKPKVNTEGTVGVVTLEGTKTLTQLNIARKDLFDEHVADTDIHITDSERDYWNDHVADGDIHVTSAQKDAWNDHVGDTDIHVTSAQKTAWTAKLDNVTGTSPIVATKSGNNVAISHESSQAEGDYFNHIVADGSTKLSSITVDDTGHVTQGDSDGVTIYPPTTGAVDGYYWSGNGTNKVGTWKETWSSAVYANPAPPVQKRAVNATSLYRHTYDPAVPGTALTDVNAGFLAHRNIYIRTTSEGLPTTGSFILGDICLVQM